MLDRNESMREATAFLAEASSSWGPSFDVRIIQECCFTDQDRFMAPYDNVQYLDHGNEDMQPGGNLPVAVDLNTGFCRFLSLEETQDLMEGDLL
ncbi:hypothetical protein ACFW5G_24665 [Streptomyces griseoaurantiacus]|uniref:hypothetical protein n=1 Tax=Streptomyces griseoaurantiacus TaxID=68213 RepID=UPI003694B756